MMRQLAGVANRASSSVGVGLSSPSLSHAHGTSHGSPARVCPRRHAPRRVSHLQLYGRQPGPFAHTGSVLVETGARTLHVKSEE